ncbi:MAG: dTMP kinase [Parcubacteria group bacterium Gr01-1014_106]|nr:MAG: dTMP kinase [Parcubacteria group bacterium Gr01-1014_106]
MNAKYVVFDGLDGSGKGTQIDVLKERFVDAAVFTREPGGTPFAEEIRKIVRDNPLAERSTALSNLLLFFAAREELQHNLVAPMLQAGKHVFSDRGDSSTFAFQLCGEQHKELRSVFVTLRQLVFSGPGRHSPDLYVVFDLPAEIARERATRDTNRVATHFDMRDLAYYERVRGGFHEFASRIEAPVVFIDATLPREEVHKRVLEVLATKEVFPT